MKNQIKTLVTLLLLNLYVVQVWSQDKFSISSGTVEFNEIMAISVEGYDGNEVVFGVDGGYKVPDRAKGLKPVNGLGLSDNTGVGLAVKKEANDYYVIYQVSRNTDTRYKVKVPKGVKVKYVNSSIHGKSFKAFNIPTEIEAKSHGGDIYLSGITGPLTVSSVHGNIDVIFNSLTNKLPSSVASVHGEVDITVPAATNADLSIHTNWGDVYSDLEIKVDNPEQMKAYSAKKIRGKLGSGGAALEVSSTHGNVYLRKK
ncbi:DUF4097 domain-containing protein [Fulvivirga sp. M361]|uniref:DUF4097 family beta strand repeat-containing protein n=1 Tax=Fulvivirga sp. M361 TaxID=2594266 RepID=UPI00117B4885|nr:DUF4097 family beta strand repeat-containing protein [Fulvivirga sp. M361]TRX56195.1 DUF4097 domain-containing protein [Fulvivirga sp. M361]